jgi:hypothetical protein
MRARLFQQPSTSVLKLTYSSNSHWSARTTLDRAQNPLEVNAPLNPTQAVYNYSVSCHICLPSHRPCHPSLSQPPVHVILPFLNSPSLKMAFLELPPQIITLQIPLLYLNNIIILAIGPKRQTLRLAISLPILILLVTQSLYRQWDAGWGNHYAINCLVWSVVFMYVDWILLSSPDKERWRKIQYSAPQGASHSSAKALVAGKIREDEVVERKTSYKEMAGGAGETFWTRCWWGCRLATTNRYTGWTQQVKNVPSVSSHCPRWRFVARKMLRTALFYLLKDIVVSYSVSTPHGSWVDIRDTKVYQALPTSSPFLYKFWFTWVHIALTCVSMEFANAAYGTLSVATGLAHPRDCPPMFGSVSDLYSVRRAWSSVWHQQCRRICSAPGIWLTRDALALRKGSFASKYVQLFTGFFISGFIHGAASMLVSRSFDDDVAVKCFLGQAAIIMLEDHVIDLGKSLGFRDSRFWRMVGLAWTVLAIGWGVQPWVSKNIANGVWVHDREYDFLGIGPGIMD